MKLEVKKKIEGVKREVDKQSKVRRRHIKRKGDHLKKKFHGRHGDGKKSKGSGNPDAEIANKTVLQRMEGGTVQGKR